MAKPKVTRRASTGKRLRWEDVDPERASALVARRLIGDTLSIDGVVAEANLLTARAQLALEYARSIVTDQDAVTETETTDAWEACSIHARLVHEGADALRAAGEALSRVNRKYEQHVLKRFADQISPMFDMAASECKRLAGPIARALAQTTGRKVNERLLLQAITEHRAERIETASPKKAAYAVIASLMNCDASTVRRGDRWGAQNFFRATYATRPDPAPPPARAARALGHVAAASTAVGDPFAETNVPSGLQEPRK